VRQPYQLADMGPESVSHERLRRLAIWPARRVTPLLPPMPTVRIPTDTMVQIIWALVGESNAENNMAPKSRQ
jgi:hypothetical protein